MSSFDHIDISGVRAILLDLGGTLYSEKICHEYALWRCYEMYARRVAVVSFNTFPADLAAALREMESEKYRQQTLNQTV